MKWIKNMKIKFSLLIGFVIFIAFPVLLIAQSSVPFLVENKIANSGFKLYQARYMITFGPGFSYTPSGGTLSTQITDAIITGTDPGVTSQQEPATRNIVTSYKPGSLSGVVDVSQIGSSGYNIPIDLPNGIGGFQPSLAVGYSSLSGEGIMGKGWNLLGLGAIERIPASMYFDGLIDEVDFDTYDRLALNGQRLILLSGTYGVNGSEYRLEQDQSVKITMNSGFFSVKTADGTTFEYGGTDDSKVAGNSTSTLSWHLSKVTNNYNQVINVSYINSEGWAYPVLISYGVSKIEFYYKYRNENVENYIAGNKYSLALILNEIKVWNNTSNIRRYNFSYFKTNDNSKTPLLCEIIYYGLNNERINSTIFKYNLSGQVSLYQQVYNSSDNYITYKSRIVNGDFNGDGRADILCIPNPDKGANWTTWKVFRSNGSSTFNFSHERDPDCDFSKLKDVFVVDLNEDGFEDVLYVKLNTGLFSNKTTFYYMLNSGSAFSAPVSFYETDQSIFSVLFNKFFRGEDAYVQKLTSISDFDGDGRSDILITDNQMNWKVFSLSGGSNMSIIRSGTLAFSTDVILTGDFNGDGITDIWAFDTTGPKIFTLRGSTLTSLYNSTGPTKTAIFQMGDFNGDGRMDLFSYGYSSGGNKFNYSTHLTFLSTGTGFRVIENTPLKNNMVNDQVIVCDMNGDGCSDLFVTQTATAGSYYFVSKNSGKSFQTVYSSSIPESGVCLNIADFNGDGRTDILSVDRDESFWNGFKFYSSTGGNQNLLTEISNGLGHYSKIDYVQLSHFDAWNVYTKGNSSTFPIYTFQGPMNVVESVEANNGIGSSTILYKYEGAKIHRMGKGFLGFSKVSTTNTNTDIVSENNYDIETTYFYPKLTSTVIKNRTSGNIQTVSNTWVQKTFSGSKRFIPYISTSTSTNNLTGFVSTTNTSVPDDYGNLLSQSVAYTNGPTHSKTIVYSNDVSNWLVARPCSITTTMARSGEPNIVQLVTTTYETGKVKPDIVKYFDGATQKKQLNHDYNANGTLSAFHELSSGLSEKHTYYSYDANGINMTGTTDPSGVTASSTYYAASGLLNTTTDHWGNVSTYSYDNLGNLTSLTRANGIGITSNVLAFVSSPTNARYSATQNMSDGSQVVVFYDLLGREIRRGTKLFNGTMSYTQTDFNYKGQAYRVSEPFATSASLWNTTTFDSYGRVATFTPSVGASSSYTYPGGNTTVTRNGRTYTTATTNATGWPSSKTDPGGTISYSYKPDGNVKQITAPGSVATTMTYDTYGNQLTLNDPSAGITTYTYHGGGELKTQITPMGTTSYYYMSGGRLSYYTNPAGTYYYSYGTNKLVSGITSPGGVSRSFTYYSNGKVDEISETIETGQTNKVKFVYDSNGRVSSKTYTNSNNVTRTEGYVYNNGYLDQITFNGTVVYDVNTMNTRGNITQASICGTQTDWAYDQYGQLTGNSAYYTMGFSYTPNSTTGNLTSRTNTQRSLSESFTYDNLDRLTGVTRNGSTTLSLAYDTKGNLSTKSDAGTLVYDNGKPYQLAHVTPYTANFPTVAQTATYTSFGKVNTITEGTNTATFKYNADNERIKMTLQSGTATKTKYYFGSSYEKVIEGGVTTEYIWIGGSPYTAVAVAKITNGGTPQVWAIFRDNLGSITHIKNGTNVQEYSYDAYGRRRDKDDWSYTLTGEPALFADRGYTGHEHLDPFGLINMNGRLYDPLVGRFLSPDNYVQSPDYTQSFNRYGYCWNNPLRYTDPEGDFVLEACLIAAGVGILIDYGMQVGMNYLEARNNPAMTAKDIWLNKIDWFDIAVSGTISGLTAGYGAAITAGETVGKFGLFMVKYSNVVSLGSSVLTSAVDITGEGWQKVEMYDFGKRVLVAGVTWGATELISNLSYKSSSTREAHKPIGRRGNPNVVEDGTNLPTTINGRDYSGHALDRMQGRGIMPSVVEDVIKNPLKIELGNKPNTWKYIGDGLNVIINQAGKVITVIPQ
jgi:RHS repeat-associated protein